MSIYRMPSGKYRYDFITHGRRLTGAGFATKREARAAEAERRKNLAPGSSGHISTFGELVDAYLAVSERTKSVAWAYQLATKLNRAASHLSPLLLAELTPQHFEAILSDLHKGGANKARSLNEYRKIMRAACQFGVDLELLARNPLDKIPRRPESAVPIQPIDTGHLKQLILAADPVLSAALTFQSQTGARWIECERLKWTAVRLDGDVPFALLTTKKNRRCEDRARAQPLNRIALAAVKRMVGLDPEYVFPARGGGPLHYRTAIKRLQALCARLDLPPASFHQVRHWVGMQVVTRGRSKKAVASYLGHADTGATERYLHALDSQLVEIATSLEAETEAMLADDGKTLHVVGVERKS